MEPEITAVIEPETTAVIDRIFNDGDSFSYEATMNLTDFDLNKIIYDLRLTGRTHISRMEKCELVAIVSTFLNLNWNDRVIDIYSDYDDEIVRISLPLHERMALHVLERTFSGVHGPCPFQR